MTEKKTFKIAGFLIGLSFTLLFSGCSLIQPPEDIPAYIRIQSTSFKDSIGQGSASNKITNIWVTASNDPRGAYQIPVSVPILSSGYQTINLQAGVRENGVSGNILPYPFYTIYTTKVNLIKGKLDTINPSFKYLGSTKFAWSQGDFEGTANILQPTAINSAVCHLTSIKDSVFEGKNSYEVDFSPGHDTFDIQSNLTFLPSTLPVWMEMNFKTNVGMDVGIITLPAGTRQFIAGINPTTKWNKIYINLSPTLQYYYPNINFKIYFQAVNSNGKDAHLLLDNLKILYP